MGDREGETFMAEALGKCPFCGGELASSAPGAEEPAIILHSLPTCAKFDALEAAEFVHAVHERVFD